MKLAVCYSGISRGSFKKNNMSVKHHFPEADYFYSTWLNQEKSMPAVQYVTYKEPQMHYHPIKDVGSEMLYTTKLKNLYKKVCFDDSYYERTLHHTKQILGHAYQLDSLDESYDMIVRVRYDTYLSPKVNLQKYLEMSYNNKIAIGLAQRDKNLHELKEVESDDRDQNKYILDPLIFHRRDMFSTALVYDLHRNKKLLLAENGWYQILSEPFNDNHLCVHGGAQIEKYIRE